MAKYSVEDVANYCVWYHNESKEYNSEEKMTNLRLQKVLYYIFGIYCKENKNLLFESNFQAWFYGPVVREVYEEFKIFGDREIKLSVFMDDNRINGIKSKISEEDKKKINEIMIKLKVKSVYKLVELTHEIGTPWFEAKKEKGYFSDIDKFDIINYFEDYDG